MIFKKIRDLERRIESLENALKANTWSWGEVDIKDLARIVEKIQEKQKTADH